MAVIRRPGKIIHKVSALAPMMVSIGYVCCQTAKKTSHCSKESHKEFDPLLQVQRAEARPKIADLFET